MKQNQPQLKQSKMSLNIIPGDAASDSYGSVAESDAYFAIGFKKQTWQQNDLATKEALLKESTRLLDQFFKWSGSLDLSSTQALRWPRKYVLDIDGRTISSTTIPIIVKNAMFEMAFHISQGSGFDISENVLDQIRVGPIKLDFSKTSKAPAFPKIVTDMLLPLGSQITVGSNQVRTVTLERV
jgi:hypothetical protein